MTGSELVEGGSVLMPPLSRAAIDPLSKLGNQNFSMLVTCRECLSISVDRTMSWTGQGAPSEEGRLVPAGSRGGGIRWENSHFEVSVGDFPIDFAAFTKDDLVEPLYEPGNE